VATGCSVGSPLRTCNDAFYILFGGLLNLAVASGLPPRTVGWRRWARAIASLLRLAAPPFFLAAFFLEPAPNQLARPIVLPGIVASLIGVLLLVAASVFERPEV